MKIGKFINWLKRMLGYTDPFEEIDYDYEALPQHVKEFMKKDLRKP